MRSRWRSASTRRRQHPPRGPGCPCRRGRKPRPTQCDSTHIRPIPRPESGRRPDGGQGGLPTVRRRSPPVRSPCTRATRSIARVSAPASRGTTFIGAKRRTVNRAELGTSQAQARQLTRSASRGAELVLSAILHSPVPGSLPGYAPPTICVGPTPAPARRAARPALSPRTDMDLRSPSTTGQPPFRIRTDRPIPHPSGATRPAREVIARGGSHVATR